MWTFCVCYEYALHINFFVIEKCGFLSSSRFFFLRIKSFLTWVAYMCKYFKIYQNNFYLLTRRGIQYLYMYFQKMIVITIYGGYISDVAYYIILKFCQHAIFCKNKYAFRNTQNIMFYFSIVRIYTIKIIKRDRSLKQILMMLYRSYENKIYNNKTN